MFYGEKKPSNNRGIKLQISTENMEKITNFVKISWGKSYISSIGYKKIANFYKQFQKLLANFAKRSVKNREFVNRTTKNRKIHQLFTLKPHELHQTIKKLIANFVKRSQNNIVNSVNLPRKKSRIYSLGNGNSRTFHQIIAPPPKKKRTFSEAIVEINCELHQTIE